MTTQEIINIKHQGNQQFHQKDYAAAIKLYTDAIHKITENNDEMPNLIELWQAVLLNRAKAYYHKKQFTHAMTDIKYCIDLHPTSNISYKARYTRSEINFIDIHDVYAAMQDCDEILKVTANTVDEQTMQRAKALKNKINLKENAVHLIPKKIKIYERQFDPTWKHIETTLSSMGFGSNYIERAWKVYTHNYGFSYNIEVIVEIIVRIQNKDKCKKRLTQFMKGCNDSDREINLQTVRNINAYAKKSTKPDDYKSAIKSLCKYENIIQRLIDFLLIDNCELQYESLCALENICMTSVGREQIVDCSGLSVLIQLLVSSNSKSQHMLIQCIKCLCHIAEDGTFADACLESGILWNLSILLTSKSLATFLNLNSVKRISLIILNIIPFMSQSMQQDDDKHIEFILQTLIQHKNEQILQNVILSYIYLAEHEKSVAIITEHCPQKYIDEMIESVRACYENEEYVFGKKLWFFGYKRSTDKEKYTSKQMPLELIVKKCEEMICGNCGSNQQDLKCCTGCMKVGYCSRKCQKIQWKYEHRFECNHFWSVRYKVFKLFKFNIR